MAKKYIAVIYDDKSMPFKSYGPIEGELTEEKVKKLVTYGRRNKARYADISRRTDGKFIEVGRVFMSDGIFRPARTMPGYGPGLYSEGYYS